MNIDWITLGIWLVGFAIWIIWIIVPFKEFMGILRARKKSDSNFNNGA